MSCFSTSVFFDPAVKRYGYVTWFGERLVCGPLAGFATADEAMAAADKVLEMCEQEEDEDE